MPTTICLQTLPSGEDNPVWLAERLKGVTATDTAQLLYGGSWMGLWAKKTGRTEPDDLSQVERVQWGKWMEPIILQAYSSERYANRKVTPSGELMRCDEHPWLLATLDARTVHPEHGDIPLDAKNTDKHMEYKWEDGMPENYAWQIRHQAIVEDVGHASIACALGGNRLLWDDTTLTKSQVTRVLEVTERFWWHVTNDVAPFADVMDASDATRRALDATYWADPDKEMNLNDNVFLELDEEYAALEREIKEHKNETLKPLEDRLKTIKATLKRAIGSHSKGHLSNGVVYTLKTIAKEPYMANPKPYNLIRRKAPKQ